MSLLSLNSYVSLIDKCEVELQQLQNCSEHPTYDYLLFNVVFGLSHLYEWYLKDDDISPEQKLACIRKFNPYRENGRLGDLNKYYSKMEFPDVCVYQEIVRKLCNKAKHFKKVQIERQERNYTVSCGSPNAVCGNPEATCGAFDHYLYVVDVEGVDTDLYKLVRELFQDWKQFAM
ncbi:MULTISPECIES: hypothetical protein [unclassified Shewanella]|uniref:hypothetical protein n=1 Tax=unclassified Shewanella TaxID=196818 RepID=UPI001BC24351|nr:MULTISPECIES: hypothetical protein [unclassified Shewanella]GIU09318.1 hypothetical protein TUM4444_11800 [Shewanella sp. MBTL60-112-B1]GIU29210.1 hypothetical protein TUM4445_11250 [Shewanella sp. MBTL60-112-B2]